MAELYLRKAFVTITPLGGQTRKIEKLRVEFEVAKTNESNPNSATIKIYNLSEKTRGILEAADSSITLEVGYRDISEVVFVGDVTKVVHDMQETDILSTIEAADGGNRFRTARLDKAFPPGATTTAVFEDLIKALGLPRGAVLGVPTTGYPHGLTLSGLVRGHLDTLTKKNELEWSIQDGAIQIIPANLPTTDSIVVLKSSTGLVGKPNKTASGVEFKSLINPLLKPGRRVKLESVFVQGIFKVRKVTHKGDNTQGDFLSEVEATV